MSTATSTEPDAEWFLYCRRKKDGRVFLVGRGEPMTPREVERFRLAHAGSAGSDYFIHKGRIHKGRIR